MDNKKINIDEIKLLIPDYVTGTLSEQEKKLVEEALDRSKELRDFYNDAKNTLQFVETVKFDEPASQYWNNLLPRIHQRIEERESKKLFGFKNPLSIAWKILVPVAAVVLIFIIYRIVTSPGPEYTKKDKIINVDTGKVNEQKQENIKKDTVSQNEKNLTKTFEPVRHKINRKRAFKENELLPNEENIAKSNKPNEESLFSSELDLEDTLNGVESIHGLAYLETRETQIFSESQPGMFDEEMENDLDMLNNTERDQLLNDLQKSNL